ncbi:MKI67 FHA DOMAIN-INTERACTING NUCLEOLAR PHOSPHOPROTEIN [Salix purpurea]|uniref:MKI67 FHA DOMAIN-INTERACTING NUCLEOLAR PHOSPHOPROTEIN n=1 Tax=Salix purpurea TaxID=77065 RepID=A0A9Q0TTH6_SALPP|nr:MKI67 FHA DOMAIN-INTERACTING NUCLEOLAR PHOSPHOPROTEIN [Salix purpurea]
MGAKAKKSLKKKMSKISSSPSTQLVNGKQAAADFLPLEGGPARNLPELKELKNKSGVLYIGRIPHGFYEDEMKAYFSQFGTIKRLRIARNKKTGKSKHFGFMEFDDSEVAEVVAECMHNYLLFEHLLQVHVIPQEHVHPKLWKGFNYRYNPLNRLQTERKLHNKERTLDEHRRLVVRIMKQDQKRRKKIEAAGLDYECPEFVGDVKSVPKKIKFSQD